MKHDSFVTEHFIDAGRFDLRPLRASDAGLITLYCDDERVAKNTTDIPHPLPPGAAEGLIKRANDAEHAEDVWAIDATRFGGAEIMGLIGLERLDREQSEIGYWVAPPFWNGRVASEAVEAMLRANPHNAKTVFASVFQDNAASARVLTNCGFEYLGDAESFSVARNAKVPTWTYSYRCER